MCQACPAGKSYRASPARPVDVSADASAGLSSEETLFQKSLHVATPISDHEDEGRLSHNPIDQPVRRQGELAKLADPQRLQLFGDHATLWMLLERFDLVDQPIEQCIGLFRRMIRQIQSDYSPPSTPEQAPDP